MLEVRHIRKAFTSVLAVDDVSFDVRAGQIFGLIGPNGAGKSTTIKMIMDILQPDAGTILLDGHPPSAETRNLIGYLPEERGLYRKNSLINVITYLASLKGMEPAAARKAAEPWLERFQLTDKIRANVEELSKGNQQKVQFILSILHAPRLVVLDELFSGLDPVNQVLMKDALLELRKDHRAVIFSTHQMDYAEKLCDDLILINKGRVVLNGSPAAIKQRYGKNSVHLEFQGEGAFLSELPGVQRADIFQNSAELELMPDADRKRILMGAAERLDVQQFARIEPSLQTIFIDTVGMPVEADTDKQESTRPRGASSLTDPRVKRAFVRMLISLAVTLVLAVTVLVGQKEVRWEILIVLGVATAVSFSRYIKARSQVAKEGLQDRGGNK